MTDTNRPQISTSEDMLSRLPYELTTGVTATREGLVIDIDAPVALASFLAAEGHGRITVGMRSRWSWPEAAERLRYREGEPWCYGEPTVNTIFCPNYRPLAAYSRLHRIAAILCDDAEAFRVLHWCVTNLGGA